MDDIEISGAGFLAARIAFLTPCCDELPVLIEFRNPGVAIPIRDEDISGRVPRHIGRTIEIVTRDACARRSTASASSAFAFPTRTRGDNQRFGFPAQGHEHASIGIELDDHVRSFIDDPDVVLPVYTYAMRENESVETLTDLAHVLAGLVEFEQSCRAPGERSIAPFRP